MLKYILKRLMIIIPILLGISFVVYLIIDMTPGDPALMILGEGATQAEIEAVRLKLGLNDPFLVRYFHYLLNFVQGNLGTSYRSSTLVITELQARIPITLRLTLGAVALMILVGIPLGVVSAVKKNSPIDMACSVGSITLTSIPSFWLGLILMYIFALKLQLVPTIGSDTWKNFILPCISLAACSMGAVVRMTRSSVLEIIGQDYVRTARAKGLHERIVIFGHVLRNSLLPIVTTIGLNFASLMGGAVVTENVFGMAGMGQLLVDSVGRRDTPMIMGSVMFIASVICFTNLLVDIIYVFVDPRLRVKS